MRRFLILLVVLAIAGCSRQALQKREEPLPDFDALWDYTNPEETEVRFRELLPHARQSGDQSYYLELLTQIARTEGLQRQFDDAHATLDSVEAALTDDVPLARVRYLLERGRVYRSSNDVERSKPFFLEAWNLATGTNADFHAVDAAHMLAIVESPETQLEWAARAISLAEMSDDDRARAWLGSLYNNTGWTYHDLARYGEALEMFEKALSWYEGRNDEVSTRIAKWTIARTYRSLDRIEDAFHMQKGLEQEFEQKELDPSGYVFEELGECLLLMGRDTEARIYFSRAYRILSEDPWMVANEADRLERLRQLGEQ